MIEGDAAFEAAVPGRAGGAADVLDLAWEFFSGEGYDFDGDLLADGEVLTEKREIGVVVKV